MGASPVGAGAPGATTSRRPPTPHPTSLSGRIAAVLADPRRVLLVAAVLVAFVACVDVLHDPDLWWHLRLGRWILDNHQVPHHELFTFTAQGNGMTAHEWGSEVLFTLLDRAGGVLLIALLMALVAWSGLVALALRARDRGAGVVVTAVALLLGARAAQPVLGTRPQVITVALVCWTLLVYERHLVRGGRLLWVVPPVALLWANLHGGVTLALGVLLLFTVLEALRRLLRAPGAASWRRIAELGGATALAVLLGCVNPNGPGLYSYVSLTSRTERLKPITEWQAPNFADPSNLGLLVLLVSFAVLIGLGGRVNRRDLALAITGFLAALLAVRNTSLAVALALPAWASLLQQVVDRLRARRAAASAPARRARPPARGRSAVMFGGVIVALALAVDGVVVGRAAHDASPSGIAATYPACDASALQGRGGVRLFAPYFDSGYLIDRLWPQGRVFIYGESASLGMAVFDDYQRILAGGPRAAALLARYGANAVIIGPGALHDTLAADSRWSVGARNVVQGETLFVQQPLAAATC